MPSGLGGEESKLNWPSYIRLGKMSPPLATTANGGSYAADQSREEAGNLNGDSPPVDLGRPNPQCLRDRSNPSTMPIGFVASS